MPQKSLRVLYVHPAGPFGGASKSLLDVLKELKNIDAKLVCPRGSTVQRAREQGIDSIAVMGLSQLDNTSFGGYNGWRKLILLREFIFLPATIVGLIKAKNRWPKVDLVHINEVTLILLVPIIRIIYPKVPIILHVRSTQQSENRSFKSRLIFRILRNLVTQIVAIDDTVRLTLPVDLPVTVIHNGFNPHSISSNLLSRAISLPPNPLILSYVGGLMAAKGVFELIEAAHICHQQGLNLRWRIFGENVRTVGGIRAKILAAMGLNGDVRAKLLRLINKYGLRDVVTLEGFQTDYSKIYIETDVVLCITHANAAGRPVFEGAFFRRPSIVAMSSPTSDTVIPGVTAICIPANSPQHLADAAAIMVGDRSLVERMGNAAHDLANKNFKLENCAVRLNEIYDKVIKEVL